MQPKIPRTETLRILLIPDKPKPARGGIWSFNVVIDGYGTAMQTHGRTAKEAKKAVATYVYSVLRGKGASNAT